MLSTAVFVSSCLLLSLSDVTASGAGRAFPIDSENYVTERFQAINPQIEWDPTNFLVDLAGHYANCRSVSTTGPVTVDRLTPEGDTISGVVDSTDGARSDIDSVNGYIQTVINRWISSGIYDDKIRGGRRFGCSVRPACTGRAVISCLFSPGFDSDDDYQHDKPHPPENLVDEADDQRALAFTAEQYQLAEKHTGNTWDRSHFLENLSGFETRCAMIENNNWPFRTAYEYADKYGVRVVPLYGSARNTGSTTEAMDIILSGFKSIRLANELGCSVIPDCIRGNEMYVVVSCLYSELELP